MRRLVQSSLPLLLLFGAPATAADNTLDPRMLQAVSNSQAKDIRTLADQGISVNARLQDGRTLLMFAASKWMDIPEVLVEKGADVNAVDLHGATALMWAAVRNNLRTCKMLIEKGADMRARDEQGNTAFMFAALNNRREILDLLISKGADINARNNEGASSLLAAVRAQRFSIARYLVDKGIDLDVKDKAGITALAEAQANKYDLVVRFLEFKKAKAPLALRHLRRPHTHAQVGRYLLPRAQLRRGWRRRGRITLNETNTKNKRFTFPDASLRLRYSAPVQDHRCSCVLSEF